MEVLLRLPTLQVMTLAEAPSGNLASGITNIEDLNPLTLVKQKKSQNMNPKPNLQMATEKMIMRHAYHKPFMVKFTDKHEWQKGFNSDKKRGLLWCMDGSKINKGTDAGLYWGRFEKGA
jgi:hypothetical protein